ncbi:AraC family transcriptional regulator [Chitinophaga solisilvae]|uniref:Helix-turn-helix transcriptional regulator n=1 Tax=Chitinophaga solisilvae TaxID=1233460 RepID=A0A433WKT8_9BACT|nr:AraC family transcriptional regulator [Chitinophaga solisilvae]NSL85234.1 helix-turn-helix transcriptional regulator [Chitinophaga solisilvae]
MGARNLYTPFELLELNMEDWTPRPLIYHFFEIIHIQEGTGVRVVNGNRFPYRPGSVFIFTPRDCRGFEIAQPTRFVTVRFSELFLGKEYGAEERERITGWLKQLEYILFNHNKHQPVLVQRVNDCKMMASLIANMMEEYRNRHQYYENNLQHYLTLLLNLIARNVEAASAVREPDGEAPLISRLITWIQQHIYYPEQLKLETMAARFNISVNYIGEFFKKQTGESIQQYIICYKLRLVELRVENSRLTIGEIADELGFSDESHMSRLFKKYYGVSPAAYRKQKKEGGRQPE